MSNVTVNPVPGIYSGSSINVTGTVGADVKSIIYTTDGTAPTLAKYIAYDNLTPPNPFAAVVQDGKGNVVFDGGFPKLYNSAYNASWVTYASLDNTFKYFANAIDFIANKNKVSAGNKKILFLSDSVTSDPYSIKNADAYSFNISINKICAIMGYTPVIKDYSDFSGSVIDMTYAALDQYAAVVFFGTFYSRTKRVSDNFVANIVAFRENGSGIMLITDHGSSTDIASNPSGFYYNVNLIAKNFGASFSGNFNRSPVNVGFLIDNYGNHPLWANMDRASSFFAGVSESKITVTIRTEYPTPQPVNITTNGYTTIRYLVQMNDGSIILENYTYGLNVPEIFEFRDNKNVSLGAVKRTILNSFNLNLYMRLDDFTTAAGIIKYNGAVIGEFSKSALGLVSYSYYENNGNKLIKNGDVFTLQLNTPIFYSKNISIQRLAPAFDSLSTSKRLQEANKNEFANSKNISVSSCLPTIFKSMIRNTPPVSMNKTKYFSVFKKYTSDTMNWGSTIYRDDVYDMYSGTTFTISAVSLIANEISTAAPLTVTGISDIIGGTATFDGSIVKFNVTAAVGQPAGFKYTVRDSSSYTTYGYVQLNVKAKPAIITATDTIDVIQGSTVSISASQLLSNDSATYPPLSFVSVSSPKGGSISSAGSTISFTSTGITGYPAGFTYQCKDANNNQALGEVIVNVLRLPTINAYLFDTTAQLEAFKTSYVPATMSQIFNKWNRFTYNTYYPSGTPPQGEAASWEYVAASDMIRCTVNSSYITGFTSLDKLDMYEASATFASTHGDNDCIMFVIGMEVVNGNLRVLVAIRTGSPDMTSSPNVRNWGLYLYTGENKTYTPLVTNDNAAWSPGTNNWPGKSTSVKIIRNGNKITCYTTPFNSTVYDPNSKIEYDLSTNPQMSWLGANKSSYGYACHSQQYSTFSNLTLIGGSDTSKLYDISTNTVWVYDGGWSIKAGATIQSELGYPRTITIPDSNVTYEITQNAVIKK